MYKWRHLPCREVQEDFAYIKNSKRSTKFKNESYSRDWINSKINNAERQISELKD